MRLADAHAEAQLLGLFVESDVLFGRTAEPVVAGAVAPPIVVHLVEHDAGAVAGPNRLADSDLCNRLDVLAGRKIADPQLEPLRPVVIRERRDEFPVRAHLHCAEPEILAALRLDRLVEDHLVLAAPDGLAVPGPIFGAGPERPPVEEVPVADGNGAVVLLDAAFHLLEQLL